MLNSAETNIYPAHKCLNANNCNVGILTFMSRINYYILSFEFFTNFDYFKIGEKSKFMLS